MKTLVKEWGINPWEVDKLTARDLQEIRLAEHTEAYVKQEQRETMSNQQSLSHKNYNVSQSRSEAFG